MSSGDTLGSYLALFFCFSSNQTPSPQAEQFITPLAEPDMLPNVHLPPTPSRDLYYNISASSMPPYINGHERWFLLNRLLIFVRVAYFLYFFPRLRGLEWTAIATLQVIFYQAPLLAHRHYVTSHLQGSTLDATWLILTNQVVLGSLKWELFVSLWNT